jgi:hypothetical protein
MAAHIRFLIYGILHYYCWSFTGCLRTIDFGNYLLFIASYRDGSESRRGRYRAVEVRQETPLRYDETERCHTSARASIAYLI